MPLSPVSLRHTNCVMFDKKLSQQSWRKQHTNSYRHSTHPLGVKTLLAFVFFCQTPLATIPDRFIELKFSHNIRMCTEVQHITAFHALHRIRTQTSQKSCSIDVEKRYQLKYTPIEARKNAVHETHSYRGANQCTTRFLTRQFTHTIISGQNTSPP